MNRRRTQSQYGAISGSLIGVVLLSLGVVILAVLSVWLYTQYSSQKSDVDSRVDAEVAKAQRQQAENDEEKFAQREKEPNRQFVGPDDYGRLTFSYPKTWSAYVDSDAENKSQDYKAYLNPVYVPPVGSNTQQFALRVVIANRDYDSVVKNYDSQVKKGDLKSSVFSVNGQTGTRLDGNFSKDIRGAAVIMKLRDKTISIFTDADTFKPDFENIIKTIKFNS